MPSAETWPTKNLDLQRVTIYLRRQDVEAARKLGRKRGLRYQVYVRELVRKGIEADQAIAQASRLRIR